jgi:uncharacterized OB-fold protein
MSDLLGPQLGDIPLPVPSEVSRRFWAGCRAGELLFQRCADCGGATHTPALICAHCLSRALHWEPSAGAGTVASYTVVHRPQTPAFVVPYVPIVVDLDEGFTMLSNVIGCRPADVHVGLRVQVEFHPKSDEITLPYFRPV